MRSLGLDLGTKTLGIAISDITGLLATPLQTIRMEENDYESLFPIIKKIVEEENIGDIVLGLPRNMNYTIGPRGEETIVFKEKLEKYLNKPVYLQDERLSTVEAEHYLLEADLSRKKRKKHIDSMAAVIILQTYLDKKKG